MSCRLCKLGKRAAFWGGSILVLAVVLAWVAAGCHQGWTMTQVAVMQVDPITEIEFPSWEKRFVPGYDFLFSGVFLGVAIVLAGFYRLRFCCKP